VHIPDGFLSLPVAATAGVASAAAVGGALRRLKLDAEPGLAPRMGLTAAYVFAAQMVNFPVASGTSGHLLGALLAAVLLGPHAATVVMTAVFVIQTFFFLDGGHTALGANVLNMGLAGTYGGYAVYRTLAGPSPGMRRGLWAAGAAAWASVMLGAVLTAAQLVLSGKVAGQLVFPAMLGVHAVIGLGEGAITAAALALLWRVRPDLMTGRDGSPSRRWVWAAAAGLAVVALLAPLASGAPDGLEWVAGRLGFEHQAAGPMLPGPFPDYTLPGLEQGWAPIAVSLLGSALMVGAVLLFAVARRASERLPAGPISRGPDARVKLACLFGTVLTAVLLPPSEAGKVLLLALVALAWAIAGGISLRWTAARAVVLLPFVGLAALSLPQFREGHVGVSVYGLVLLRALTSFLATAAFLGSTPEAEVLASLRAARLPVPVIETIQFALRYLRLLRDEAGRMLQARAARSAGAGTLALRAEVTGGIVGSLFLRSLERSERVARAMEARGYRGDALLLGAGRLQGTDWLFAAGFGLFLIGIWIWR
jgi:cobalt/nickel transport system permease protein